MAELEKHQRACIRDMAELNASLELSNHESVAFEKQMGAHLAAHHQKVKKEQTRLSSSSGLPAKGSRRSMQAITAPSRAERKFDFFINHCQATGQDQASNLAKLLEAEGCSVWYDMMAATELNSMAMERAVADCRTFLIFLSDGLMARPFCQEEQRWAKKYNCKLIGVFESDERHGRVDFAKEEKSAPDDLKHVLTDVDFVAYRRRGYEVQAMVQELLRRHRGSYSAMGLRRSSHAGLPSAVSPADSAADLSNIIPGTQVWDSLDGILVGQRSDQNLLQITGHLDGHRMTDAATDEKSSTTWKLAGDTIATCVYGDVRIAEQIIPATVSGPCTRTGNYVAVKQMSKARISANHAILHENICAEVQVLRQLQRSNCKYIVNFVAIAQDESYLYLLTEFVTDNIKKRTTLELLDYVMSAPEGQLDDDEARHFFIELLGALDHLHRRGIFHLDVSLDNILITTSTDDAQYHIKLIDFGLAKQTIEAVNQVGTPRRATQITETSGSGSPVFETVFQSRPAGKATFAAPEVFRDEDFDGAAADLWSAGIVLFTMLTGQFLYQTPTQLDASFSILVTFDKWMSQKSAFYPVGNVKGVLHSRGLNISEGALDLLGRMLIPEIPEARFTLAQVRQHGWLKPRTMTWQKLKARRTSGLLRSWPSFGPLRRSRTLLASAEYGMRSTSFDSMAVESGSPPRSVSVLQGSTQGSDQEQPAKHDCAQVSEGTGLDGRSATLARGMIRSKSVNSMVSTIDSLEKSRRTPVEMFSLTKQPTCDLGQTQQVHEQHSVATESENGKHKTPAQRYEVPTRQRGPQFCCCRP
eukprot:COSAG05_NODE_101_length_19100_cov_24.260144_17_plen_813_part_00